MAIVRQTFNAAIWTSSATTSNINKPSGLANGDVLLWTTQYQPLFGDNTIRTFSLAGWTAVPGNTAFDATDGMGTYALYKVITNAAGEPASYTFTASAAIQGGSIELTRYSGVDNGTPIDATTTTTIATNTTSPASPSITTTVANTKLVGQIANPSASSATSAVWTVFDSLGAHAVGDLDQAASGASGTKAWTVDIKGRSALATNALRPVTAPAAGIPDVVMAPLTH